MTYAKKYSSDPIEDNVNERREFLRKSIYVAYTTPVILSLLVENASAARSHRGITSPQGVNPYLKPVPPPTQDPKR
jgi:hypothetical protein